MKSLFDNLFSRLSRVIKTKFKTVFIFTFISILIVLIARNEIKKEKIEKNVTQEENPLSFTHSWNNGYGLSHTTLEFTQDAVYMTSAIDSSKRMEEGKDLRQDFVITKEEYPKLFEHGVAKSSAIDSSALSNVKDKYGGDLVILTNTQPSHGGFSPTYAVVVSPFEGKVVFETPEYFSDAIFPSIGSYPQENFIRLNFEKYGRDVCNSCNINFLETYEYDPEKAEFYLANNKHTDEFYSYLNQYTKMEEAGCFYQGQTRSFNEIKSIGGDNAQCEPKDPDFSINNPLTMAKFYAIKNRLEKIMDGENISMYE